MNAVSEVPPPVQIPVSCVRGDKERRQRRWLFFWLSLAVGLGGIALVIYFSGPYSGTRGALAMLVALPAIVSLFPAILFLNSVLDWRRDQADKAAREFSDRELPLDRLNEDTMAGLHQVLRRTGRLRVAPNFVGTDGDRSYLMITARARQVRKSRLWVVEIQDEVTVLMARDASVQSIEEAFPELRFRAAA